MGGRARRDRFPSLTVEGQSSQLKAGTAGYITSGAGYILANPARADTAFVLLHIPHAARRVRYTRARRQPGWRFMIASQAAGEPLWREGIEQGFPFTR